MGELEDSVIGGSDVAGPPPLSMAQPDIPSTPLQTQFAKVAGQKERDLGQLGNGDLTGPQAGDQSPAPSSLEQTEAKAADIPPPDISGDASSAASVQKPAASGGSAKQPAVPDWTQAVAQAIQQNPSIGRNPFLQIRLGADPQKTWHTAVAVGRAWNALVDPTAMAKSAASVWDDQSIRGYIERTVLEGMFPPLGVGDVADEASALAGGKALTPGQTGQVSRWLATNALPMALTAGADSSLPTFALSATGSGPTDLGKIPGALAGASPIAAIQSAISDPKQLTTPEGATRLFWKYAMGVLNMLAVMPVARQAVRPFINPAVLADLDKGVVAAKLEQPTDINKLPTADELIPAATEVPNVSSRQTVAGAAGDTTKIDATLNKVTGEVQVSPRSAAAAARSVLNQLGLENWGQLAEKAGQMSDEQVQLLKREWSNHMPYDLVRQYPEDRVAVNPMDKLDQVAPAAKAAYRDMVAAGMTTMAHIRTGPFAQEANAVDSLIHSLLPQHRTTNWLMQQVMLPAIGKLAAVSKLDGVQIQKALRDPEAYDALSPEGQGVVDMWDLLSRTVRDERGKVGFPVGAVPSFDPRVAMAPEDQLGKLSKQVQKALGVREGRGGTGPLVSGNRQHRAEAFVPNPEAPDQVMLAEKHPDVFSINREQQPRQMQMVDELLKQGVPQEQAVARAAAAFPLYHEDFFKAMSRELPRAIHSLHSYQAADIMRNAITGEGSRLAYQVGEKGVPAGYKAIDSASGAYRNMLWHPEFADRMNELNQNFNMPGALQAIDKLNNIGRTLQMMAPTIHGENLLGRAVDLTLTHPSATLDNILGRAHDNERISSLMRQLEAYKAGVVPHLPGKMSTENLYGERGHVTGDASQFDPPGLRDDSTAPLGLRGNIAGLGRAVGGGYQYLQNRLWDGAANFATNAYHIEKTALDGRFPADQFGISHNVSEESKQLYAANRANLWQGRLGPEEWNKTSYMLSRLLFFAPNWQRSFYELMAPTYNTRALAAAPELRRYMWANEVKTIVGMAMAQSLTGNAMNLMLSGHSQWENDPGNRHKIEVTNPAILRAMQAAGQLQDFDANSGRRASDGGVVTMENPWARQQTQVERATGFDDMTPGQGVQTDLAGQTAPAWAQIASALNIDLYRSIHDGQIRHVNPNEGAGPNLDNILPTLMNIINPAGLGQQGAQQETAPLAQSHRQQAQAAQQLPPWLQNTAIPLGAKEMIAGAPDAVTRTIFGALTGTAAPYVKAPKSPGESLSDSQIVQKNQITDSYDSAMTDLSGKLLSGEITPRQWLIGYQNAHTPYSEGLKSIYRNSPQAMGGQQGLVAQYLNLDTDPTVHDPQTGAVDYGKLAAKQDEFKAKLTPQQVTDLNAGLQKNSNAYPALAMYRFTQQTHDQVYATAAQQIGMSPAQLRSTVSKYGSMSGPEAQQYLAQHPEIRQYESLNKQWEMNTWSGRLYGLYYMTPTVQRWLMANYGSTDAQAQEQASTDIERQIGAKPNS